MKYRTLLLFAIASLAYMGCRKQEHSLAVIPAPDPITKIDTVKPAKPVQTSSTRNTFSATGLMTNFMYDDMSGLRDTATAFAFTISYLSADSIDFASSQGVILSYNRAIKYVHGEQVYIGVDIIGGRFKNNDSNAYHKDFGNGEFYSFRISRDSLYASWMYVRDILGACDQGVSQGHFAGRIPR
jgi:hypothetical protein